MSVSWSSVRPDWAWKREEDAKTRGLKLKPRRFTLHRQLCVCKDGVVRRLNVSCTTSTSTRNRRVDGKLFRMTMVRGIKVWVQAGYTGPLAALFNLQ